MYKAGKHREAVEEYSTAIVCWYADSFQEFTELYMYKNVLLFDGRVRWSHNMYYVHAIFISAFVLLRYPLFYWIDFPPARTTIGCTPTGLSAI